MKVFTVILLTACFVSCKSLLYTKAELTGIPGQANIIMVKSSNSADSLFARIARSLVKSKWIINSSKEGGQIGAESKLMYYRMYVRPIIYVKSDSAGSVATFRGTWSRAAERQNYIDYVLFSETNTIRKIKWGGYRTDDGAAFQNLMFLAQKATGVNDLIYLRSDK